MGPMLLRSLDRHIGLSERLASALAERRHTVYIQHTLGELLARRIYQTASAYEDGNDADRLRHDPMFQMGLGRRPLGADSALASGATFSRLENTVSARDMYRMAKAFVDQFIILRAHVVAGYRYVHVVHAGTANLIAFLVR
jgi:hypothetical protein